MSWPKRDAFLNSSSLSKRWQRSVDSGYEAQCVGRLLGYFNAPPLVATRLMQIYSERTNTAGMLTFAVFHEVYPDFPIRLGASRLKGAELHIDPRMFLPALFKAFWKTPFMPVYERLYENTVAAAGRVVSVGLIFPRQGVPGGLLVHNSADLERAVKHGLTMTHRREEEEELNRVYVQPFQSICLALHGDGHGLSLSPDVFG